MAQATNTPEARTPWSADHIAALQHAVHTSPALLANLPPTDKALWLSGPSLSTRGMRTWFLPASFSACMQRVRAALFAREGLVADPTLQDLPPRFRETWTAYLEQVDRLPTGPKAYEEFMRYVDCQGWRARYEDVMEEFEELIESDEGGSAVLRGVESEVENEDDRDVDLVLGCAPAVRLR